MKLKYIRLTGKGMQVSNGRLREALASDYYDLTLISNLRCVKVMHADWDAPVYIPCERLDNFSPLPESFK